MPAISITDTYDALLTTTLAARGKQLWDNLELGVNLFRLLGDDIKDEQSGHRVEVQLLYGSNSQVKSRGDYDLVPMDKQDGITLGYVPWRDLSGPITISDRERAMNQGRQQVSSLLDAKMRQLEVTMKNQFATDLASDGTGSNQFQGLQYWFRTATATVAGIDDSVNTWWQNQSITSVGSFASNGRDKLRQLRNNCSLGANEEAPDLIITTQTVYEAFEKTFDPIERYSVESAPKELNVGVDTLKFHSAFVTWNSNILAGAAYMINRKEKRIRFVVLPDHYMKMTPMQHAVDQRVTGAIMSLTGNLVVQIRKRMGVMTGITA